MNPEEIAGKQFPVVMRGYVREDVHAFLTTVASRIAERDSRIASLERELAQLREQQAAPPPAVDRPALLRQLGEEAASILACADSSAERLKAQADMAVDRVRRDLRGIGTSLVDVHQLLGELVSLVQGLAEDSALGGAESTEAPDQETATHPSAEIRDVLGGVLGLDDEEPHTEVRLPEEADAPPPP